MQEGFFGWGVMSLGRSENAWRAKRWGVRVGFLLVCTLLAYALKRFYSRAQPEELLWMLEPTSYLVERTSGLDFFFETGVGFINQAALLAVTKACAGINFMIIAACVLAWTWSPLAVSLPRAALWLTLAWIVAYAATLVINTARILVALEIHGPHRLEGTAIYFAGLVLLHAMALALGNAGMVHRTNRARSKGSREPGDVGCSLELPGAQRASRFPLGYPMKRTWLAGVPAVVYLGVTLLVPLLNGAVARGPFLQHASVVIAVTTVISAVYWHALQRRERLEEIALRGKATSCHDSA